MPSKKDRLIKKAQETRRTVRPARLAEPTPRRGPKEKRYKVVAVSLFPAEDERLLEITARLRRANPNANRSVVVRWAISRLARELQGKSPVEHQEAFAKWQLDEAASLDINT